MMDTFCINVMGYVQADIFFGNQKLVVYARITVAAIFDFVTEKNTEKN